jgi:pimeloyl-ACP methyl ester carboxylesterase
MARSMTAIPAIFSRHIGLGADAYVCVPGLPGDHRIFNNLAASLPPRARMQAIDLPGHGLSAEPAAWTLEAVTQQMAAALDESAFGEATLVGEGLGALLGMRAALLVPGYFRRLVLVNAFATPPWHFRFTATDNVRRIAAAIPSVGEFARLDVPVDVIFGSRASHNVVTSAATWKDLWAEVRIWEVPRSDRNLLARQSDILSELVFQQPLQPAPHHFGNIRTQLQS